GAGWNLAVLRGIHMFLDNCRPAELWSDTGSKREILEPEICGLDDITCVEIDRSGRADTNRCKVIRIDFSSFYSSMSRLSDCRKYFFIIAPSLCFRASALDNSAVTIENRRQDLGSTKINA